ncbi:hypothetical protein C0991_012441 [Blastosporella zonata]|nr:hypothetical protein C0991_012441 [Blastosporella zonata]
MAKDPDDGLYELIFERDNPCNTTIFDSEVGKVLYQVSTEHGEDTITRVKRGNGEEVAAWVWKDVRSDIITFGAAKPISVSSWLRKSLIPMLFLDEGPDNKEPLVRFCKTRINWHGADKTPSSSTEPARLLIDDRGMEIKDIAVVSFLVLEKTRRAREAAVVNRAGAPFGGPGGPPG